MNSLGLLRLIATGVILAMVGGCGGRTDEPSSGTETPTVAVRGVPIPSSVAVIELR